MPEEQTITAPVQSNPVSSGSETSVAPGMDASLDSALEKMFNNNPAPTPNEKPTEAPKPSSEKPVESKPEVTPQSDKTVSSNDPLPDPEKLDSNPPKKQDGWTSLKNNYKRAHKIIADKDGEIAKLKTSLSERGQATTQEVEALKKQVEELSGFRAMIDIEADPEFTSKFDAPIEKNVTSIKEMLRGMDVSDDIIEKVDFSNPQLMDEIINHVTTHRDKFTAKKLERKVQDLLDLTDKRNETLTEQKSKHKEYLENKKKESFTKNAEMEGKTIKRLEELSKNIPFLNKMNPKEGAIQAEIDQVNKFNEMVALRNNQIKEVLKEMESPEGKANAAVASVAAQHLNSVVKAQQEKISKLEEELKKISGASSESEKTRNPSTPRASNGQWKNSDGTVKSVDEAMKDFFGASR